MRGVIYLVDQQITVMAPIQHLQAVQVDIHMLGCSHKSCELWTSTMHSHEYGHLHVPVPPISSCEHILIGEQSISANALSAMSGSSGTSIPNILHT